jgi:dTDP-4-dehydrorhamnose 3,5-epimerase
MLIHNNIQGVEIYPIEKIEGEASFIYKISKLGFPNHKNFQEIYCSCLYGNKIRGWYKHENVEQNFSVIKGSVNFVIYDPRHESLTKGRIEKIILDKENFASLHLPVGVWYSFRKVGGEEAYIINCLPLVYEELNSESLPINSNHIPYIWENYGK